MKALIPFILMVLALSQVSAQQKLTRYFPAGEANAGVLIDHFIKPLGEDICVLPNNGWYTTPKTHKKWGFDLSVTVNTVFVSNEDKSYGFPSGLSGLSYSGIDGVNGGPGSPVPTVYGNEGENPEFLIVGGANDGISFRGPDGFEPSKEYVFDAQPIFTLQGGIGLFKNTDLRLRFTPKVTIQTAEFSNWGVGIMHDLMQHFSTGAGKFNLSIFLGYTQVNGTVDLSGSYAGSGQEAVITSTGFTGQAVIGKEFKIISFYGAVGYDVGNTDVDINGSYDVDTYIDLFGDPVPLNEPFSLTDPYSYKYDQAGMRFTVGLRLKLGPVTLNGDYSFVGDNRVLTAGFGFTVK